MTHIKEGDTISYYTCCNADRKLYTSTVMYKEHWGFYTFADGVEVPLRQLIDIKING